MASLGNDLAHIRKEQDLSLEDIHKATKIPEHILRSIEDDSIFTDLEESSTYIRSYIRSYAKALSIDDEQIIYALNKKEKGNYEGSLLNLSEGEQPPTDQGEEAESPDSDKAPEPKKEPESGAEKQNEAEQATPEPGSPVTESPSVQSIDWADMGKRFQPLESTKSKIWIGIVTLVLIIAGGTYLYLSQSGPQEQAPPRTTAQNEQPGTSTTASTDSLQLNIVPPVEEGDTSITDSITESASSRQGLEALPDTLNLLVYAAYGKLEPVRVYTDIMDGINPYWIEEGTAIRFNFVNEIRIRGQYSRMALLFNGHALRDIREKFYNEDTRLLEIRRSFFENNPELLEPAPDSLSIDAPRPSAIKNRPTFN